MRHLTIDAGIVRSSLGYRTLCGLEAVSYEDSSVHWSIYEATKHDHNYCGECVERASLYELARTDLGGEETTDPLESDYTEYNKHLRGYET